MPTTYYLSAANSDLGGGDDFSKALVTSGASSGSLQIAIDQDPQATRTSYGHTPAGDPSASGGDGDYTFKVEITEGNYDVRLSVSVSRLNSAGEFQSASSSTDPQTLTSAGTYTFNLNVSLGTWQSGDRLRVEYHFSNIEEKGSAVTIGFGDDEENSVVAPWDSVTGYEESGACESDSEVSGAEKVGLLESGGIESSSSIAAGVIIGLLASGAIAGSGSASAQELVGFYESGAVTGTASVAALEKSGFYESGSISGGASASAQEVVGLFESGAIAADSSVSGANAGGFTESGAIYGVASVSAQEKVGLYESGEITGTSSVSGTPSSGFYESGAITSDSDCYGREQIYIVAVNVYFLESGAVASGSETDACEMMICARTAPYRPPCGPCTTKTKCYLGGCWQHLRTSEKNIPLYYNTEYPDDPPTEQTGTGSIDGNLYAAAESDLTSAAQDGDNVNVVLDTAIHVLQSGDRAFFTDVPGLDAVEGYEIAVTDSSHFSVVGTLGDYSEGGSVTFTRDFSACHKRGWKALRTSKVFHGTLPFDFCASDATSGDPDDLRFKYLARRCSVDFTQTITGLGTVIDVSLDAAALLDRKSGATSRTEWDFDSEVPQYDEELEEKDPGYDEMLLPWAANPSDTYLLTWCKYMATLTGYQADASGTCDQHLGVSDGFSSGPYYPGRVFEYSTGLTAFLAEMHGDTLQEESVVAYVAENSIYLYAEYDSDDNITPADPRRQSAITVSIQLSQPYTVQQFFADLGELSSGDVDDAWDLADDVQYPWRTDGDCCLVPVVRYNENPTPQSIAYVDETEPWVDTANAAYDGAVVGGPLPNGYGIHYQFSGDAADLGWNPQGGIPDTATVWNEDTSTSYPNAWVRYQDDVATAQVWASTQEPHASLNYFRPCGADRDAIDERDASYLAAYGEGDHDTYCKTLLAEDEGYPLLKLYPDAWPICGRVEIDDTSEDAGTVTVTLTGTGAPYLRDDDTVDFVSYDESFVETVELSDVAVTRVSDTEFTYTGSEPTTATHIKSHDAPHYRWQDVREKGDFIFVEWFWYLDIEVTVAENVTGGVAITVATPIPGLTVGTPVAFTSVVDLLSGRVTSVGSDTTFVVGETDPEAGLGDDYGGSGGTCSLAIKTCTQGCNPRSACAPSVMSVNPAEPDFPNATNLAFTLPDTLPADGKTYFWQGTGISALPDPFDYRTVHDTTVEGNPTGCDPTEETVENAYELVEARCAKPCGAPAEPPALPSAQFDSPMLCGDPPACYGGDEQWGT